MDSQRRPTMNHKNKMLPYLIGAGAVAAALIAFGAPLGALVPFAFVLICPLMMVVMMVVMMGGMGGMHGREDHTGHGCEHDPAREAELSTSGRH
jgi:hypothetical protein